jgi:hypothetical protein
MLSFITKHRCEVALGILPFRYQDFLPALEVARKYRSPFLG